jgi:PPK2 family polyphosphate:nucleotide phosphotransferase
MKQLSASTRAPENLDKQKTKARTQKLIDEIAEYQKILFAEGKRSLLIVLQGIDASGKDGLIASVFTGLNPFGVNVCAFKAPSEEERSHDFLWRIHQDCPARGMIHIFNRSHYEDILVPRVNKLMDEKALLARMNDINHFESLLQNEGTTILKFYLHISREEQAIRLRERKTNPEKFWKHNDDDWKARRKWDSYMETYELIFRQCNEVPWHIIPADQNWYKEYLVATRVRDALRKMKLQFPTLKVVGAKKGR